MGDPRKIRSKYKGPNHPWQRIRIDEERIIKREYGLKNKKEIWKASSELKRINAQVKKLIREIAKGNPQAFKEEKQLLDRLYNLGLIQKDTALENVLSLNFKDLLDRRLQTIVYRSGLAATPDQARQFIGHRHIIVNGKRISIPSYLVNREEQFKIGFDPKSAFISEEHPERAKKLQAEKAAAKKAGIDKKKEIEEAGEITEEQLEHLDKIVGGDVIVSN